MKDSRGELLREANARLDELDHDATRRSAGFVELLSLVLILYFRYFPYTLLFILASAALGWFVTNVFPADHLQELGRSVAQHGVGVVEGLLFVLQSAVFANLAFRHVSGRGPQDAGRANLFYYLHKNAWSGHGAMVLVTVAYSMIRFFALLVEWAQPAVPLGASTTPQTIAAVIRYVLAIVYIYVQTRILMGIGYIAHSGSAGTAASRRMTVAALVASVRLPVIAVSIDFALIQLFLGFVAFNRAPSAESLTSPLAHLAGAAITQLYFLIPSAAWALAARDLRIVDEPVVAAFE